MRKSIPILLCISLCAFQSAFANPPSTSTEEYQQWLKDQYIPNLIGESTRQEDAARETVQDVLSGKKAHHLRGASAGEAQSNAERDELKIKDEKFKECNDGRITIFGDPERRPPRPCQEEVGFFDRPNKISFMCPFGIFSNACGSDQATGFELGLLCASDPGACGVHFDNKHPGTGGAIGIAILTRTPAPPLSPCTFIYTTATYVEYYFPWVMLNTSRQMYQSGYIDESITEDLRKTGRDLLKARATLETSKTVNLVARSSSNTTKALLGEEVGDAVPANNREAGRIALETSKALDAIDAEYRDLSPHGQRQYTRNFSSVLDIRFQQPLYWYVPHYPLDTHRFGSEFPPLRTPIDIPMPTGEYQPSYSSVITRGSTEGGLMHSRFLSASAQGGSARMVAQLNQMIAARGATRCVSNNKATGKTPLDFLPQIAAGKADPRICLDDVGPRFPFTSVSFSAQNTDAFWRGLASGGLDLFYALNWPRHYDSDHAVKRGLALARPGNGLGGSADPNAPYHVYFDEYDRVAVMPNPETTDPNFADEIPQCGRLQEIADLNVNYRKANIHKPLWGAQNTVYVWGLVKGVWSQRGRIPLYELEFNTKYQRQPDVIKGMENKTKVMGDQLTALLKQQAAIISLLNSLPPEDLPKYKEALENRLKEIQKLIDHYRELIDYYQKELNNSVQYSVPGASTRYPDIKYRFR